MADFTPVDTFTSPVPALSDGQPANAAVLNAPHQALVNRTHWLKETIDSAGITRDGATRIREVADEDALKALTGMADGDLAITQDKALLFRYSASAADAELARWVVAPASGVGRWLNTAYTLVGGANGIVKTDANERIPAAMPKNGVVAINATGPTPPDLFNSTDEKKSDFARIQLGALEAGDVIDVFGTIWPQTPSSATTAWIRIALLVNGAEQTYTTNDKIVFPGITIKHDHADNYMPIVGRHIVKTAGDCELVLVCNLSESSNWLIGTFGIGATVRRP